MPSRSLKRFSLCVASAIALVTSGAAAQDVTADLEVNTNAFFAKAWVRITPADAVVEGVELDSTDCGFASFSETEPGVWYAEGPPGSSSGCGFAIVRVLLPEPEPEPVLEPPGFGLPCPFVGTEAAWLVGRSSTDSHDSSAPDAPGGAGHVCSNGPILVIGKSTVHGNALHGPDAAVHTHYRSTITGVVEPLAEPIELAAPDPGDAATVNDNDSIPLTERGRRAVDKMGTLRVRPRDHLTLGPGTYYFRKMMLFGGSVDVTGPATIYVERALRMWGAHLGGALPSDVEIVVLGTRVQLVGHSELEAMLYAPHAAAEYGLRSRHHGDVVAKYLSVHSGSTLLHDATPVEGEPPPPAGPSELVLEWYWWL